MKNLSNILQKFSWENKFIKLILLPVLVVIVFLLGSLEISSAEEISSDNIFNSGGIFNEKVRIDDDEKKGKVSSSIVDFAPDLQDGFNDKGGTTSAQALKDFFGNKIGKTLKYIFSAIFIVLIVIGGFQLLTESEEGKTEEEMKTQKNMIYGSIFGMVVILLAPNLIDKFLFRDGNIFDSAENVKNATTQGFIEMQSLIDFTSYFLVGLATLFIIINAITLVASSGQDDAVGKAKDRIFLTISGLATYIAAISIAKYLFPYLKGDKLVGTDRIGQIDTVGIVALVVKFVNYGLGFVALVSVSALVYAGIRAILHFESEEAQEEVKNIVKYAIIGLVLSMSIFTIVYYFSLGGAGAVQL
jgi:hypothetical protein